MLFNFILISLLECICLNMPCTFSPTHSNGGFHSTLPSEFINTSNQYITQIELDKAWDISRGKEGVCVGVIDSGFFQSASDVTSNINYALSNSFVPYYSAFNPYINHGTMMASIIGATANNGVTAGVNWNANLAILRVDNPSNYYLEDVTYVKNAIIYATINNIPILNFSGGFYLDGTIQNTDSLATASSSELSNLHDAINSYPGLIICSSGNEGNDFDASVNYKVYPACFDDLSNVITVGGCYSDDTTSSQFNYSENYVDLLAPAYNIHCLNGNNVYTTCSGTSPAAALVTGVAALIKSVNPNLTTNELKNIILSSCDTISDFTDYSYLGRRLNAYKAIKKAIKKYSTIGSELQTTYQLQPGEFQWFEFNAPAAGYNIESTGSIKTSGYLHLNIQNDYVEHDSGDDLDNNFSMSHTFLEYTGTKCFVKIENIGTTIGYSNLKISLSHTHDYTYQYTPYDRIRHIASCYDGAYKMQEHVIQITYGDTSGVCIRCGDTINFGLLYIFGNYDHAKGFYILDDGTILINKSICNNEIGDKIIENDYVF